MVIYGFVVIKVSVSGKGLFCFELAWFFLMPRKRRTPKEGSGESSSQASNVSNIGNIQQSVHAPASHSGPSQTPPPTIRRPVLSSPSARAGPSSRSDVPDLPQAVQASVGPQVPGAPPSSSKAITFPRRPGLGKLGRQIMLKANFFLLKFPHEDIFHYDVTISPQVPSKNSCRTIITDLSNAHGGQELGNHLAVYDGRKSMYTAGRFPFSSKEFTIKVAEEDVKSQTQRREKQYKVVIKFASQLSMHRLEQFLSGDQTELPQDVLQALDVVLRESPSRRFSSIGHSFFSGTFGRKILTEGLEAVKGFFQSARPTQSGLALNIDMSATTFIKEQEVIAYVADILRKDLRRPLVDADLVKVKTALKGLRIEVTHRGNMRRKYRIVGLSSQSSRETIFTVERNGTSKRVSVYGYFYEVYNMKLVYPLLPCLQVGSLERPSYIPMEVCKIVKGQRYLKSLNQRQTTEMLTFTCQDPRNRETDILKAVVENKYNTSPYVNEFGIEVSETLVPVHARLLACPKLKYCNDRGREISYTPELGYWNMRDKRFLNGGRLNNWTCVNFSSSDISVAVAMTFYQQLFGVCRTLGMTCNLNPILRICEAQSDSLDQVLNGIQTELTASGKTLDLLFVILPNNGPLYGDLKYKCETEYGWVSQCCLRKTIMEPKPQLLGNLALKVNVKVGGRNTALADPIPHNIPQFSNAPFIVFGADVTHPRPGDDASPSIAAVVASRDWPQATQYAAIISGQGHRKEIIEALYTETHDPEHGFQAGGMIREHLLSFKAATNREPAHILFFRDGVSEGQFSQVVRDELTAINKGCKSLGANYEPRITFVVVQKRHHTKFFPQTYGDDKTSDKKGNLLPGTVVDRDICHPAENDFYLCSHGGLKGTSRPAHYHVLHDDNKLTADQLQSLIYNMCYTYVRCNRSVSIIPAAYYADLAAFRGRHYRDHVERSESGRGSVPIRVIPSVKDRVKRFMFYC
ncbi:hypothetical protein AMTRI_Chr13g91340 [Amborella trichopoda]|uniref:Protein argonaute 7 n=1 Tax=Amborella trichopoda TaxID=13333 RepID=W1PJH9_AMBTC|nr:protein argonaute 1D [Amborella trichopoda]ERN10147.1 hypothetical protein AMTR_s00169p00063850 [Amborella trichopoda]|eukprot:XP_006848566.1 protein argonaute 1D [Amborella trichopoda]